jgi:hypothetical protein
MQGGRENFDRCKVCQPDALINEVAGASAEKFFGSNLPAKMAE